MMAFGGGRGTDSGKDAVLGREAEVVERGKKGDARAGERGREENWREQEQNWRKLEENWRERGGKDDAAENWKERGRQGGRGKQH